MARAKTPSKTPAKARSKAKPGATAAPRARTKAPAEAKAAVEEAPAPSPAPDLDAMTREELAELEAGIDAALAALEQNERAEALRAAEAAAGAFGFRVADLVAAGPPRRSAPARPKYRHPEEPGLTWSGRGRRPRWFSEALERGETAEGMEIAHGG